MTDLKKGLKKNCQAKRSFVVLWLTKKISDKEYEHAFKVWNTFEITKTQDYPDLYLKTDVLLLDNVFEKFRNNSLKNYGLCLSYDLSRPGLSCNTMPDMLKVDLELNSDHA